MANLLEAVAVRDDTYEFAVDAYVTAVWPLEVVDGAQQGRLARSRGAKDGCDGLLGEGEIDAVEDLKMPKGFLDAADLYSVPRPGVPI